MADLFYPQLRTGAIAHYPILKTTSTRTVSNVLPDGTVLMYSDDALQRATWAWEYVGLTLDEAATLQEFFKACNGPLRPFTFLDPTGNLLSASGNFTAPAWKIPSSVTTIVGPVGPLKNIGTVRVTNQAQAAQEVSQTLNIPTDYTYCFSIYASAQTPQSLTIFRRSTDSEEINLVDIGNTWKRIYSSGNLPDKSTGLSVGIRLSPGQQVSICAAQLEAQPKLSAYRDRPQAGDIYPAAHWAMDELTVRHVGPNNCSIHVSVER